MELTDPSITAELRRRVVHAGVDAFRAEGHRSVRVADIARVARVDTEAVEMVFPSWDLLVIAILDAWSGTLRRERVVVAETEGGVAYVRSLLEAAAADPALIRTRMALLGAASDPAHPGRGWYRAQYSGFVQDVGLFLTRDVIAKREPRSVAPLHAAEQVIALYEGLQLQSTLLDTVELLPAFDRAIARLRAGWADPAAKPVPVP